MMRRLSQFDDLQRCAGERRPKVVVILGSGLSDVADCLGDAVELPFGSVPGLDSSSVPGHRGVLLLGRWSGIFVLVFAGRLHYYEGHPWRRVVQPIHIAQQLGASIVLATNAAGGIRDDLGPGDLMAVRAHLDCTRETWWRDGIAFSEAPYTPRLLASLSLPTGIYAQLTGPCYETPAEIRALRACGAHAIGMSTGREMDTAHALGMECAAISCITNKAAGLSDTPIDHAEVMQTGQRVRQRLIGVIEAFLAGL